MIKRISLTIMLALILFGLLAPQGVGAQTPQAPKQTPTEEQAQPSREKVNINKATVEELWRVPGINAELARAIFDFRSKHGKFKKLEDLKKVQGMTDEIYDSVKDYLTI
jgi:comEA protein